MLRIVLFFTYLNLHLRPKKKGGVTNKDVGVRPLRVA